MNALLTLIIGYLLGSISSGVLLSKALVKEDIRKTGSGNAGTTNMLRTNGRELAGLTLLCDILKGIIAVIVGYYLVGGKAGQVLGALGAVLGHNFPVFFGFKGGKGIATSFGSLLVIFPLQTLAALVLFIVCFVTTHYVSVGSIAAAFFLPVCIILTVPYDPIVWFSVVLLGALAVIRHHQNISRLLAHKENKIDFEVFKRKGKLFSKK